MVGKLTKDNQASCSILETIMGGNPWKSQTEQLADCILANEGKVILEIQILISALNIQRYPSKDPWMVCATPKRKDRPLRKIQRTASM